MQRYASSFTCFRAVLAGDNRCAFANAFGDRVRYFAGGRLRGYGAGLCQSVSA